VEQEPLPANLFLHYVIDVWTRNEYPQLPFQRYAGDAIVHQNRSAPALREEHGGNLVTGRAASGLPVA
jgi:hypothetical protein